MNLKFKNRLLISFIFVAIITLTASTLIFVSTLKKWIIMHYSDRSMVQMEEIDKVLNQAFLGIEDTLNSMLKDETIVKMLDDPSGWEIKKANIRLYDRTQKSRELADFYLYDSEGQCVLSTVSTAKLRDIPVYWGAFKQAKVHPDEMLISNANGDIYHEKARIIVTKVYIVDEDCAGYAVAILTDETLSSLLDTLVPADCDVAILDSFWNEVYSSKEGLFDDLHARRLHNDSFANSVEDNLYFFKNVHSDRFTLAICVSPIFTEGLKGSLVYESLFVAVIACVICVAISGILTSNLLKPLNSITDAMNRVKQGDFEVSINSSRKDEFGQLSRDFDDMTKALKVYIDLRTKAQKELSESNIAMMQAQLNPHFLYNTLDTIKWVAKANHVPELAVLSSSLAKILRASISAEIFVKLSDEMELIENYIEIQKIRFPDNFSFDAELPFELEDAIVPKLILQPIVENAIVHGLKDRTHGHVFLNVYSQKDRLIIDVEDDGWGMDQEILKMLNMRDTDRMKGHIGFSNVDTIIRLHYGLNYGLHAQNLETGGTRVTIELPVRFGEAARANQKASQKEKELS